MFRFDVSSWVRNVLARMCSLTHYRLGTGVVAWQLPAIWQGQIPERMLFWVVGDARRNICMPSRCLREWQCSSRCIVQLPSGAAFHRGTSG